MFNGFKTLFIAPPAGVETSFELILSLIYKSARCAYFIVLPIFVEKNILFSSSRGQQSNFDNQKAP